MGEAQAGGGARSAIRDARGNAAPRGAAAWLCLAAAPSFAIMAVLAGVGAGGSPHMPCATAHDGSPLNGMVLMYALMSLFHAPPWLKLITSRDGRTRS